MSASQTPVFWTSMVKVWLAPPAVTVAQSNVLVDDEDDVLVDGRGWSVLLVSLAAFGSIVPSEATVAVLRQDRAALDGLVERDVDGEAVAGAPAARPVVLAQVTSWPTAEQRRRCRPSRRSGRCRACR